MNSNVERIHVHVLDDVYELIGEISSSSSEREVKTDQQLENYLINDNLISPDSKGMARTKQTISKQVNVNCGQSSVDPII